MFHVPRDSKGSISAAVWERKVFQNQDPDGLSISKVRGFKGRHNA